MRESQYQSVDIVEGYLDHLRRQGPLAFEDDFVLGVEGIAIAIIWRLRSGSGGKAPVSSQSSAGTVHGGTVVGVLLAGVAPDGVVDNVFAAELDFVAKESASGLIDHATAHTTTVDHDSIGMVLVIDVDDFAGELGCGISVIAETIDGTGVGPLRGR